MEENGGGIVGLWRLGVKAKAAMDGDELVYE